jgi:hypothetical protein
MIEAEHMVKIIAIEGFPLTLFFNGFRKTVYGP